MEPDPPRQDHASMRHLPDLYGIETLSARYVRQSFKPHAHDEYLFGVIDGGVHAVWCRGEMNHVPQGSVVTMRPGDVHHGGAGSHAGWHQRMIYLPEAGMRALLADITGQEVHGTVDFSAAFHACPDLARRFVSLHEVLHNSTRALARDVAVDSLLCAIFRELAPHVSPEKRSPDGRVADAMDYLDSRMDENVTLQDLCQVTGLGRRQTISAFQRATGLPPHAWHVQRRIERVRHLLRKGTPLAAAAAETGFADQSHMGRHFVSIVGVTPAAYARG